MPPDLNSLPPSPSPSASPIHTRMTSQTPTDPSRTMSQSPPVSHTPPHSLAAAAALNAGIQNEESRRGSSGSMRRDVDRARRRSSIRMNLNLNDPTVPAPGEMQMSPPSRNRVPWPQSPHHERAPSLGELHQELEYEQEGQVNRLLNMIRQQQAQITALQQSVSANPSSSSAVDDSTPTSERSLSLPQSSQPHSNISPVPTGTIAQPRSRSPYGSATMSRQSSLADRSRGTSQHGSPAIRPLSSSISASDTGDWLPGAALTGAGRDESAFYQAETQMLTRENQMLKLRIRELERQLSELNPISSITHSPVTSSGLLASPALSSTRATQGTSEGSESGTPAER